MSFSISPSKALRWEDSQCFLNQYPTRNMKPSRLQLKEVINPCYAVDSAVLAIYPEQFHGKWCIQNRVALTSVFVCTEACSRSAHEKSRARPAQKHRHSACKGFSSPSNGPSILEGSSMDEIYDALAQQLFSSSNCD